MRFYIKHFKMVVSCRTYYVGDCERLLEEFGKWYERGRAGLVRLATRSRRIFYVALYISIIFHVAKRLLYSSRLKYILDFNRVLEHHLPRDTSISKLS